MFPLDQLRFQKFEADPDGSKLIPLKKFRVSISWDIG